ncbi:MAG: hypothetical protein IKA23_07340 [Akkermansia sp.]|nr:hypothetical protein [Akkermansia sp.]MBR2314928.1 hypothetical protein [Akkermansia sp.]
MPNLTPDQDPVIRAQAWVGDAVLALYVREWILSFKGEIDGALFIEFTSNNFLRLTGNATGVEAQIGRIYTAEGLAAANNWIEENLRPRMEQRLHKLRVTHPHHRK